MKTQLKMPIDHERDEHFMAIARLVAEKGTCDRAKVGAVIVKGNDIILGTGVNTTVFDQPTCDEVGHVMSNGHCVATVHAEINALLQCLVTETSPFFGTIYVTHEPCLRCTQTLIQANLIDICYEIPYGKSDEEHEYKHKMLKNMDFSFRQIKRVDIAQEVEQTS